jgi:hypothetical protein
LYASKKKKRERENARKAERKMAGRKKAKDNNE